MAGEHDATEFVDTDFLAHKAPFALPASGKVSPLAVGNQRAPSREDVDRKVVEAQQKLAELRRAQEELEREREKNAPSRVKSPLRKLRFDQPVKSSRMRPGR